MSCPHCSQTPKEHEYSHVDTLMIIASITELGLQNPKYKDLLDTIMRDWRTHALPACSDFAYD